MGNKVKVVRKAQNPNFSGNYDELTKIVKFLTEQVAHLLAISIESVPGNVTSKKITPT